MAPECQDVASRGDVAALRRLIAEDADGNAKDQHGQTALMMAAPAWRTSVIRCLLECQPDLNHTAKYHLSALMLPVLHLHVDVVRALVDAGVDLSIPGNGAPGFRERTALDLAEEEGHQDLIEVFQSSRGKTNRPEPGRMERGRASTRVTDTCSSPCTRYVRGASVVAA